MNLMSIDQSLSHCGVVIWKDGVPHFQTVIRTGSTSSKGKRRADVHYFDTSVEQIEFIIDRLCGLVKKFSIDKVVMESLSFGSVGNATRDLAGLFYCIMIVIRDHYSHVDVMNSLAPTSIKSFARSFLPEEMRTFEKVKKNKAGKEVKSTSQLVMGKKEMVIACDYAHPGFLDGYTMEGGKGDLADAFFIGKKFLANGG